MPLLLIFLLIPIIELMVFFAVVDEIGFLLSALITIFTAILGSALIKKQGARAFADSRTAFARGDMPLSQIFDGFCLVISGAFLITPGFVTDGIGLLLLIPNARKVIRDFMGGRVSVFGNTNGAGFSAGQSQNAKSSAQDDVLEGEYEAIDDTDINKG